MGGCRAPSRALCSCLRSGGPGDGSEKPRARERPPRIRYVQECLTLIVVRRIVPWDEFPSSDEEEPVNVSATYQFVAHHLHARCALSVVGQRREVLHAKDRLYEIQFGALDGHLREPETNLLSTLITTSLLGGSNGVACSRPSSSLILESGLRALSRGLMT